MEKQKKVLNKINHCVNSGNTTPLGTKPNDECYTSMQDILTELSYWAGLEKFKGKNIICPCDWDITDDESVYAIKITYRPKYTVEVNNIKLDNDNSIDSVCLKKYIDDNLVEINLPKEEIDGFLKKKLTCNFIRTLTQNAKKWQIKSITASGYNPATGRGIPFQRVDFSKYDICITNPPFSLYAEFLKCIIGKIDFICLAPFLNRVTPNIGLPLMLKQAYLGKGREMHFNFRNPTKENAYQTKIVNCDWLTSWDDAQKEVNANYIPTGIKYEQYKDEYLEYPEITMKNGSHPIRVPSSQYPEDYDDWMIGSISILDNLNQDMYEWYGTNYMKYYNSTNPEARPFAHKTSNEMMKINGKQGFHGIVFRKKPTTPQGN